MRFLMMVKATEDSEAGVLGKPEEYAAMGELMEDMAKAGHLILADGLKPSSEGKRLKISGGKIVKVIDGPFTETKELIAGYVLADFPSWEVCLKWSERFAAAIGEGESEIRPLFEANDFPEDVFPAEAAAREQALRDELQSKVTQR
ncbi:MAG: YciI family protein [Actinomycetota bacterium]